MPLPSTRFLTACLGFVALTLGVGVAIEAAVASATHDFIACKYEAVLANRHDNALILGASLEAHGIDPGIFEGSGLRWYNYGYNGAGPLFFARWYAFYRAHNPAPVRVLLGVDWFYLSGAMDRLFEQDASYLPWSDLLQLWRAPGCQHDTLLVNRLALMRSRLEVQRGLELAPSQPSFRLLRTRYHDGYVPLGVGLARPTAPARLYVDAEAGAVTSYRALLAQLASDKVEVVLLRTPELLAIAGDHHREADHLLDVIGARGLPLLDYTGERGRTICVTEANFVDWCHLNVTGSQLFGQLLARDWRRMFPAPAETLVP